MNPLFPGREQAESPYQKMATFEHKGQGALPYFICILCLRDSVDLINRLIGDDEDLRAMFYQALRRPNGIHHAIDIINSSKVPSGTSKAYALQKLSDEGTSAVRHAILALV